MDNQDSKKIKPQSTSSRILNKVTSFFGWSLLTMYSPFTALFLMDAFPSKNKLNKPSKHWILNASGKIPKAKKIHVVLKSGATKWNVSPMDVSWPKNSTDPVVEYKVKIK